MPTAATTDLINSRQPLSAKWEERAKVHKLTSCTLQQSGFRLFPLAAQMRKTSCEHWSNTLFLFLSSCTQSCIWDRILPYRGIDHEGFHSYRLSWFSSSTGFRFLREISVCLSKHQKLNIACASKICGLMQITDIRDIASSVFWVHMNPKNTWPLSPSSMFYPDIVLPKADKTDDMPASLHRSYTVCQSIFLSLSSLLPVSVLLFGSIYIYSATFQKK